MLSRNSLYLLDANDPYTVPRPFPHLVTRSPSHHMRNALFVLGAGDEEKEGEEG